MHPNRDLSLRHTGSTEPATLVPVKRLFFSSVSVVVRVVTVQETSPRSASNLFSPCKIYSQTYKQFSFMCKRF